MNRPMSDLSERLCYCADSPCVGEPELRDLLREAAAVLAEREVHDYTGDPEHCHDCALRAFVKAELRRREAEDRVSALQRELVDVKRESAFNCPSCGRHDFGLHGPTIRHIREAKDESARLREQLTTAQAVLVAALVEIRNRQRCALPGAEQG